VEGVPLLHVDKNNKYSCLDIEAMSEEGEKENICEATPEEKVERRKIKKGRKAAWEKRLPREFTVATTPSANSLRIKVQVQATDTAQIHGADSLVDCGASGLFMDVAYVQEKEIETKRLADPIQVRNVDGSPNENGPITEVADMLLHYKGHTERVTFAVTRLGKEKIILGLPWLKAHNPEIDWVSGDVKMTRCPARCQQCRTEVREERKQAAREAHTIRACRMGPFPRPTVEVEEVPDEEDGADDDEDVPDEEDADEAVEEGDRVFMTAIRPDDEVVDIRATGNFSQRLAEAYNKNAKVHSFRDAVPDYLHDFEDVFAEESFDALPERKKWDHAIELVPNAQSRNCKIYPLSPVEQKGLDEFIEENLASGRIRSSKSPMAAPCFFIKKKDGSLRLIQDYRALNDITVKNRYPLPLISELIERLKGARWFTKLDVRWGYRNVRIKEGDEWKAAFRTNRGLFEPLVMMFGLTNAPSTFQTMMNDIFADLIAEGKVCVYLDDILIFSRDLTEHRRVTRIVMERLRKNKLFLKPEKCDFEKRKIEYLGVIISEGQVEMDPVKVAGVADWPTPSTKKELQQFLGFTNFYRRFILDYSHIAQPLFVLTGKKDFKWGEDQTEAFQELKNRITRAPVLTLADDSKPFRVEADSSDVATGAVLSQQSDVDSKWHPVAYLSKSLSAVERNYEIHDKEMLAIIRGLEDWRHFLEGARHKVEIWTDHKNLEYFRTAKKLNRRQARWSLYLSRFDFTLHHRPGRTMGKSDALSRRPDHGSGSEDNSNIVLLDANLFAVRALEVVVAEGEEREMVREIRAKVKEGLVEDSVAAMVKGLKESKSRTVQGAEWNLREGLVLYRDRIYVPNDPDLRRRIVAQHHDTKVAGHAGRWKTLELVARSYWWPQMSRYIGTYCRTCDMCLRTKKDRRAPVGHLQPLAIPQYPWQIVSVDFITELPEANGYDAVMVAVDTLGKRAHFMETHTTITASGAARLYLNHIWKLHGLPEGMISDRGPQFVAEFMRELYRLLGIRMASSTAYHPQTDGQTERVNQELEQYIRIFVSERQDNWNELLPLGEFQYNNHVHSATQTVPFLIDHGRLPRMGFEPRQESKVEAVNEFVGRMKEGLEEARSALKKAKDDMVRYYDRHHGPTPQYKVGDRVFLDASDLRTTRPSHKLAHRFVGPYSIKRKVGTHAYELRLPPSMSRIHPVFHVVKLKPAPEDPIAGRRANPPPDPVLVDGEEEYEVEEIMNSRFFSRKLQFLVAWKGYGREEWSWVNEKDLHAPELVEAFYQKNPGAPRRIRCLTTDFARSLVPRRGGDVRGRPLDARSISAQTRWSRDTSFAFATHIKSRGFARPIPRYTLG
jgi:hypothetical protein